MPVAAQITITLAKYDFTSRYEQFLELLIHTDGLSDHADKSFPQIKLPDVEGI